MGAALVPRPSRERNARSESAAPKQKRREEVEEVKEGDAVNREKMQQPRSSKVSGNDL